MRAHAKEMGEAINADKAVAMGVVRAVMEMADGQPRKGRKVERESGAWVEEVCTWERFEEGLARTDPRKGVGCDGWNAYLMRKAPEGTRRMYWRALQEAARGRRFPEEWKSKVMALPSKQGDPGAPMVKLIGHSTSGVLCRACRDRVAAQSTRPQVKRVVA